jgi:single-stranded DNA-specific DHH superfamily exonuclease
METVFCENNEYEVIGYGEDGRINALQRINPKTKMKVKLSFSNDVDINEVDSYNAQLLENQKHYLLKQKRP